MGISVLSCFDGMACGMLAMQAAGIEVDRYVAYEIDKYAIKVASHNFPQIEQCCDVFKADFTQYQGFDYLIGGSPCTYWSIAQKNNRETEASGLGWELFSQYVRALHEAKPKYFIYENNKSMSKQIRASIDETFGFEAVGINSSLVSAQNRQRLYWVGNRNDDGTYSKVNVEQPEDRGILLKDVLDNAVAWRDKSLCIDASYYKGGNLTSFEKQSGQRFMVAEPVCVAQRGRYAESGEIIQHYESREDGKTNAITTVQKDNAICEPVCMRYERSEKAKKLRKQYEAGEIHHGFHELSELHPRTDGKTNTLSTVLKDNLICEPIRVGCYPSPDGTLKNSQGMRLYSIEGKSVNLTANGGGMGAKTGLYAIPVEFENGIPIKTISYADGKTYDVYTVKDGQITIKGKQYPIKLADGYYIIRKLTVSECKRLQTVPEWYDFSVISNSQAYKCLGNGWTIEVIAHLINATKE